MVRILKMILVVAACLAQPLAGQAADSLAVARRVVAAASLAAKEYALGVTPPGGEIIQPEEVSEAKLFIQQAQFDIPGLPAAARAYSGTSLATITGRLPMLSSRTRTASTVSVDTPACRTISTSGSRYGGLK